MSTVLKTNTSESKMPVLFVGHGSPMNIIEKNEFTDNFIALGAALPRPKAILAISAHWLTDSTIVQNMKIPKIIYDFYGFPEELYKVKYPTVGDPQVAADVAEHVSSIAALDDWGLDHGIWSVLVHMYPKHDIPVLQLSINKNLNFKQHFELAKEIQFLRTQGVLILSSGNVVHNLHQIKWNSDAPAFDWNLEFDQKVRDKISNIDFMGVVNLQSEEKKLFEIAHPTAEHFLPLLYALGAAGNAPSVKIVGQGAQNGSISMTSFLLS